MIFTNFFLWKIMYSSKQIRKIWISSVSWKIKFLNSIEGTMYFWILVSWGERATKWEKKRIIGHSTNFWKFNDSFSKNSHHSVIHNFFDHKKHKTEFVCKFQKTMVHLFSTEMFCLITSTKLTTFSLKTIFTLSCK